MINFRYQPKLIELRDSYATDRELYDRVYQDHATWFEVNGIAYEVHSFRWPEMMSKIVGYPRIMAVVECEVVIENDSEAMMFRLFSGLTAD